ncbi:MAG: hypothetical protein ABR609_15825 [Acidimicrobiia bacterium]
MTSPKHRRMAYGLEFDRRGGATGGTESQQAVIRGWLESFLVFGSRFDLVMRALAKKVKTTVPYVNIEFDPGIAAFAGWYGIYINVSYVGEHLESTFAHELGHVVGINLLSDRSEGFAEEFKNWVYGGQSDGPVWDRLSVLV